MNHHELIERTGITYKQFDYWHRKGWLNSDIVDTEGEPIDGPGNGYRRRLTDSEARVTEHMARLVQRGFTPHAAATIARTTAAHRDGTVIQLGRGVHLYITEEQT